MSIVTRPMLASAVNEIETVKFPVACTPKLDGIRCLMVDGCAVTRKFKPVPNHHIRSVLETFCFDGLDGEILAPGHTFNEIQSLVMSEEGEPDFVYNVFDWVYEKSGLDEPYMSRMERLKHAHFDTPCVECLFPVVCEDVESLLKLEKKYLKQGHEGIMLRSLDGPYKCNRSTLREGYLLKLKRFNDSEAEVIGFEEKLSNTNQKEKNELGLSKRSSKKAGLVPANTLGCIVVRDIFSQKEFSIGTGFDDSLKSQIWKNKKKYLGKLVKYKYQEVGAKDLPRFPVFLGFRDKRDMS
jgi:DNA ligase-1